MGIPLAYVQELAGYWGKSYDMQRVADRLNRYEQFMTTIDGVDIHLLHVRSPVEGATPCIMTHGWPGSVIEFIKVIDPLVDPVSHGGEASDALELVIPSLPGHGWSGKPTVTGWSVEKIAQAWIELMDRLGHERWVAQGGDWGALVSSAIGRLAAPAKLIGIHFNWALADPAKLMELGGPSEEEQRYLARLQHSSEAEGGYAIEQATKPQTVGYGLTDSPVGQLAWIVEKFKTWSDCGEDVESSFTKDEPLDNVMVYWLNTAAASSARLYWHSLASSVGSFGEVPAPSAVAALAAGGVTQRAALTASFAVLGHLRWLCIPAAIVLESTSMAAFAIMLRRLLAAGGASVGVRPMLATAYAANAVSVSVPLAGPGLATGFIFRRFTRQGADAPLAGWSLLAGGVASSAAAALVVVGGGLASGKILVAAVAVPGGVLAVAALVMVAAATRGPRLRGALERPAAWTLRQGSRLLRRDADDPRQTIRAWAERLGSLQLPPSGWMTVTGLALANWLADAAVLAVSIRATGAAVPWHDLLLVYGSGIAAQSLNITPGGLGVAEGTLSLALIATGLRAGQALAAVLLYRLANFWLVALAGWLVLLWLRRARHNAGSVRTMSSPTMPAGRSGGPPTSGRQPATEITLPGAPPAEHHLLAADAGTTYMPAKLGAHELVLLHGQPGSAADWLQVAGRLPAQLHAVAADRPGYGSSQLRAGGFAANAQAVLDDLDSRGIKRAVLVGHSYGGGVALSAASLAPHRVEAVVLLASVGPDA